MVHFSIILEDESQDLALVWVANSVSISQYQNIVSNHTFVFLNYIFKLHLITKWEYLVQITDYTIINTLKTQEKYTTVILWQELLPMSKIWGHGCIMQLWRHASHKKRNIFLSCISVLCWIDEKLVFNTVLYLVSLAWVSAEFTVQKFVTLHF